MDRVSASHGGIRRSNTGLAKLMSSTWRVLDFSKGRNRNMEAVAFFLLILYFVWVIWFLPSRPFAGGFQIDSLPDKLMYALVIRMLASSFRGRRSMGLLRKQMQSALMVLETLASLFVDWVLLSDLCVCLWGKFTDDHELAEEFTGEAEPDPDVLPEKLGLALALAAWVVVSAIHSRIRRRNSGLAKLMQSAVIALAYSVIFRDLDMEIAAGAYIIWLAISVLGLPLWIEVTGGTEHLREWGMGLFGHLALLDPNIFTYATVIVVWIALSAFYSICESVGAVS